MATHKSAVKRAKQNEKKRERNSGLRATTRTALKKARTSVEAAKTSDEAKQALQLGERLLRKATSKGVIPAGRVNRLVSRLASAISRRFSSTAAK